MKLTLESFGGIIPGTDPLNLPPMGAQEADNVDLTEGTIKPWAVENEFRRLHDDSGNLLPGFPADDIAKIVQGAKVTKQGETYLFNDPAGCITIRAAVYITYVDGAGAYQEVEKATTLTVGSISRTTTGFVIHGTFPATNTFSFQKGISYRMRGPFYQVRLAADVGKGGSDTALDFPSSLSLGGSQLPSFGAPIFSTANGRSKYQYGTLEVVDVNGFQVEGSFEVPDDVSGSSVTRPVTFGKADFTFECNYIRNRIQRTYYVMTNVDASERDGPVSDVSEEVVIEPGKIVTLSIPNTGGAPKRKLYRSANSASGFARMETIAGGAATYIEDFRESLLEGLPATGDIPHATTTEAVRGALQHPAGYFVYFFGADLRPSAEWIDVPRPWAVPLEYAYTFDSDIECLALSGSTILVFTQEAVYRAHGQHPGRLAMYRISDKPILSKLTLWQDDVDVGWCNEEGLVIYDGRAGALLTGPYMRADRWQAYAPETFRARVNDKTVCLFGTVDNLRYDFRGDRTAALSHYSVTDGSAAAVWKSKVFDMPKPMQWYAARLTGVGDATVRFYGDGVERAVVTMSPQDDTLLPRMPKAWQWEVQIETDGEVTGLDLATNRREL